MKRFLLLALAVFVVFGLVACGNKEVKETGTEVKEVEANNFEDEFVVDIPKNEQEGTAGSNIPLKDNLSEAENQIKKNKEELEKKKILLKNFIN